MAATLLRFFTLGWLWSVCMAAPNNDVTQTPLFQLGWTGENVSLKCSDPRSTHNTKYWYRQKKGAMVLIGYSYNAEKAEMEKDFPETKMTIEADTPQKSTLTIQKLSPEDTATYFCASSIAVNTANKLEFGGGTILSVLETGKKRKYPKVKIYLPNKQEYKEHKLISLVCVATGFYPEHVRLEWFVNDITWKSIYENVPQESDDKETFYTSKRLSLTRLEYFNPDNTFKCVAGFIGDDPKNKTSDEVKGEADCSISKEEYGMYIYQGKISYIMVLCKSAMYGIIVVFIIWRRKAIGTSS